MTQYVYQYLVIYNQPFHEHVFNAHQMSPDFIISTLIFSFAMQQYFIGSSMIWQ